MTREVWSLGPRPVREETETDVVKQTIIAINRMQGVRCMRNNNGFLPSAAGGLVPLGLGKGSPDIVGIITIGGSKSASRRCGSKHPFAFAFGVEMKKPIENGGRHASRTQRAWATVAQTRGMFWALARSPDEACGFVANFIDYIVDRVLIK